MPVCVPVCVCVRAHTYTGEALMCVCEWIMFVLCLCVALCDGGQETGNRMQPVPAFSRGVLELFVSVTVEADPVPRNLFTNQQIVSGLLAPFAEGHVLNRQEPMRRSTSHV